MSFEPIVSRALVIFDGSYKCCRCNLGTTQWVSLLQPCQSKLLLLCLLNVSQSGERGVEKMLRV